MMDALEKRRILVVDDEPPLAEQVHDLLEPIADVEERHDGASAIQRAQEWLPELIVLDVILGDMDGFEVCRRLREEPKTKGIPILLVTDKRSRNIFSRLTDFGSDSFLYREDFGKYLLGHVRTLLLTPAPETYPPAEPDVTLSILCLPDSARVVMRLSGDNSRLDVIECESPINPNDFCDPVDTPRAEAWREMASRCGGMIFRSLFSTRDATRIYEAAVRAAGKPSNLRLRIATPDDLLRVPFEYLHDKDSADDIFYLVLRHPFARLVTGREISRIPLGRHFFNRLGRRSLPILLIGSDPDSDMTKVSEEIQTVKQTLESGFRRRGIHPIVDVIAPEEANYEDVVTRLEGCKYQIVHFAGHGQYNPEAPDSSSLTFFPKGNRNGCAYLKADELARLLRDSDVRFLYLSCCESGAAAGTERQGRYDLLGLADGALRGGAPSVLTFRSAQKDVDLAPLASTFYEKLTQDGDLDRALWLTRLAKKDPPGNNRWISPGLFIQREGFGERQEG